MFSTVTVSTRQVWSHGFQSKGLQCMFIEVTWKEHIRVSQFIPHLMSVCLEKGKNQPPTPYKTDDSSNSSS